MLIKCPVCKRTGKDLHYTKFLFWGIFGERICNTCLEWAHKIYEANRIIDDIPF